MQIVIDIPEEDYKGICHLRNEQLRMLPVEVAETLIRIANGTPLNEVLDEIKAEMQTLRGCSCSCSDGIIDDIEDIIDKYRKGE